MSVDQDALLARRLSTQSETYLSTVTECVDLLPKLFDEYARSHEYQGTADEIRTLESKCDEHQREISSLLIHATVEGIGLEYTRIHLNARRILEIHLHIDEIANIAEQIADDLITMKPPHIKPHFQQFQEMATCATKAVDVLKAVMSTIIRSLCNDNQTATIVDEVRRIKNIESSCDRLRNELVERVFADESVEQPLIYREFALLFDRLIDTIEDVTDQLILISSSESWITTEADFEN